MMKIVKMPDAMRLIEKFKNEVARNGLEAGVSFAKRLPERQQKQLVDAIENGGAGWVAAWLNLRLAEKEAK